MIKIGIRKQDNNAGFIGIEGETYGIGTFTPIKEVIIEGITADDVTVNGVDVFKVYVDGVLVFDDDNVTAPDEVAVIGIFAPPVAFLGEGYSYSISHVFSGPVTGYNVSKPLPAGLSISTASGIISGVPSEETTIVDMAVLATSDGALDVFSNVADMKVIQPAVGDFSKLQDIVNTMAPGDWVAIPDTVPPIMTAAELTAIEEDFGGDSFSGSEGGIAMIESNSGATSDGVRWWFMGGGTTNYGGNEVLEFNMHSLTWRRLTPPSPLTGEVINAPTIPEAHAPASGFGAMRTYGAIAWSPVTETLWLAKSTSVFAKSGSGLYDPLAFWEFNPNTLEVTRHNTGFDIGYGYLVWDDLKSKFFARPRKYDNPGPYYFDENINITEQGDVVEGPSVGMPQFNPTTRKIVEIGTPLKYQETLYETDLNVSPVQKKTVLNTCSQEFRDELSTTSPGLYAADTDEYIWLGNQDYLDTKRLVAFHAGTNEERIYPNSSSVVTPTQAGSSGCNGKLMYVPEVDAYLLCNDSTSNVYVHKRDTVNYTVPDANVIRAIVTETDGTTTRAYTSIYEASQDLNDGETITVQPGDWYEGLKISASNITVNGINASVGRGVAAKACVAFYGTGPYTINDLEMKNALINGVANAAGFRNESNASPLIINRIESHNNCNGALTSNNYGDITITDSYFHHNGEFAGGWGQEHNIYIGMTNRLEVYNSLFRVVYRAGHIFKCRALESYIHTCKFYHDDEGWSSRVMDFPMGGKIDIIDSVIGYNPIVSEQLNVISFAVELPRYDPATNPNIPPNDWHYMHIDNCLIMSDMFGEDREVYWPIIFNLAAEKWPDDYGDIVAPVVTNSVIVGNWRWNPTVIYDNTNTFYTTREEAGLPPYPSMDFEWPPVS